MNVRKRPKSMTFLQQQRIATLAWERVQTPIGECVFFASDASLCWLGTPGTPLEKGLEWAQKRGYDEPILHTEHPVLRQARDELIRYFAGERVTFTTPLDMKGTPFQIAVWRELCNIPYGETRSYGEIALAIGRPSASRAVGAANGANPLAIIVPCHRVIGGNGTLIGYGGGLPTKLWLLRLEGISHM
jgi:O-6-methylguanine DNA methyltransferase